jgi:hypothetical protein
MKKIVTSSSLTWPTSCQDYWRFIFNAFFLSVSQSIRQSVYPYPSVRASVRPFICLFADLSISWLVCETVGLLVFLSISPFVYMSVGLNVDRYPCSSVRPSICQYFLHYARPLFCLSVFLFVCLSFHLIVCLSVYRCFKLFSVCLSFCPSSRLYVRPSVSLSVHVFISL